MWGVSVFRNVVMSIVDSWLASEKSEKSSHTDVGSHWVELINMSDFYLNVLVRAILILKRFKCKCDIELCNSIDVDITLRATDSNLRCFVVNNHPISFIGNTNARWKRNVLFGDKKRRRQSYLETYTCICFWIRIYFPPRKRSNWLHPSPFDFDAGKFLFDTAPHVIRRPKWIQHSQTTSELREHTLTAILGYGHQ